MSFDPEDFFALAKAKDQDEAQKLVSKIFGAVDVNGSGFIEKEEMVAMFKEVLAHGEANETMEEETAEELADGYGKEFDEDGDGLVSEQELLNWIFR